MSIKSEIERLDTAKLNLKTAIQKKGVIIPSYAKLDTFSSYVDQISQETGDLIKSGSVTFAQSTNAVGYQITHNLGEIPTAFGWVISKKVSGTGWNESVAWMLFATTSFLTSVGSRNSGFYSQLAGKNLQQDGIALLEATESTIKLAVSGALPSDEDSFKSGESIEWFVW